MNPHQALEIKGAGCFYWLTGHYGHQSTYRKEAIVPHVLPISELGNPVLRERAKRVENALDPMIQTLIDDMIETCREAGGVGIAAPQVFKPLRLFVVFLQDGPLALINPVIIQTSREVAKDWEGCLSIPGIVGLVTRHTEVAVSFTNRQGQREARTFSGRDAIIVQHENDHLNGMVFLDRTDSRNLITKKVFERGPGPWTTS